MSVPSRSHIIVLGGHRLSTTYIRHLFKAKSEGLIHFDQLSLIDETPDPFALKEIKEPLHFIHQPYAQGLQQILESTPINNLAQMCVIPDHTAPHVLFQLFINWLKNKKVETQIIPFVQNLHLPFQKTLDSGICAISYATWICPLECEEPDICPAINNKRDWDFAKFLKNIKFEGLKNVNQPHSGVEGEALSALPMEGALPAPINHHWDFAKFLNNINFDGVHHIHLFACNQLAYGVCEIPLLLIWDEFQKLIQTLKSGQTFLVGTHSKCHGILGLAQIQSQTK